MHHRHECTTPPGEQGREAELQNLRAQLGVMGAIPTRVDPAPGIRPQPLPPLRRVRALPLPRSPHHPRHIPFQGKGLAGTTHCTPVCLAFGPHLNGSALVATMLNFFCGLGLRPHLSVQAGIPLSLGRETTGHQHLGRKGNPLRPWRRHSDRRCHKDLPDNTSPGRTHIA